MPFFYYWSWGLYMYVMLKICVFVKTWFHLKIVMQIFLQFIIQKVWPLRDLPSLLPRITLKSESDVLFYEIRKSISKLSDALYYRSWFMCPWALKSANTYQKTREFIVIVWGMCTVDISKSLACMITMFRWL